MELEDLRIEWAARDRALEAAIRLNTAMLRESWLQTQRTRIQRLGPLGPFSILVWILTGLLLALFLVHHIGEPKFLLPALALQTWVVVFGVAGVRQWQALRRLDLGGPLIRLQTELETLRIRRLRAFKWSLLTGQVVWWVPFLIVTVKGVLGVNLYTLSPWMREFLFWNVLGGLAFIPLA